MLNSNLKEESPQPRGRMSPFNSNSIKRAKTDWWPTDLVLPSMHNLQPNHACPLSADLVVVFTMLLKSRSLWWWRNKERELVVSFGLFETIVACIFFRSWDRNSCRFINSYWHYISFVYERSSLTSKRISRTFFENMDISKLCFKFMFCNKLNVKNTCFNVYLIRSI